MPQNFIFFFNSLFRWHRNEIIQWTFRFFSYEITLIQDDFRNGLEVPHGHNMNEKAQN
jgi:hypothetical protein